MMANRLDIQTLKEKRNELLDRLERIHADLESGLDTDMEDQALQQENRETLAEIARVTQEELDKVLKDLGSAGE